ncbi:MAG: chemotaxis protein CheW [Gammaproteobacteria bacterium]|nr:chemotaxis protein CheW [Gammaproteobacteria bacterium]
MKQAQTQAVQSFLLPTAVVTLLLPGATVAEVIGIQHLTTTHSRSALVGTATWRGLTIPIVSFEALSGQVAPAPKARTKIVVLYPGANRPKVDFYGILASADPRSLSVSDDRLQPNDAQEDSLYILQLCKLDDDTVAIPNLPAIRKALDGL